MEDRKIRVVILAPSGVQSLDVVGPAEVFWEAARRLGDPGAYDIQIMSTGAPTISGTGSLRFVADRTIHDPDQDIDTLLVAGDPSFHEVEPEVIDWIQRRAANARRFGSICTGVFILGKAGLLSGKRVATHWECADLFENQYPDAILDRDAIFIRDKKLCTAAGLTSGIDLALSLVEEDHGRDIAMIVARYMVVFLKRSGGQSQFSTHLLAQMSGNSLVQDVQNFILGNLERDLCIDDLAKSFAMSSRNLNRVFHRETGQTPMSFLTHARVECARRLLEETDLSVKEIAFRCGLFDAGKLRRTFWRSLGISPTQYRERFR